jgi:hypothetical protein
MLDRDECCSSAECAEGRCFRVNIWASEVKRECDMGGAGSWDLCIIDECESDQDCPGGLCTPPGYGEQRVCLAAGCARDEDCTAEPGGACALLALSC